MLTEITHNGPGGRVNRILAAMAIGVAYIAPIGSASSRTQVVLLGTGTPGADPERSGPATAIVVDDRAYLVDFGPGVVRPAPAAPARGVPACMAPNPKVVFVTTL